MPVKTLAASWAVEQTVAVALLGFARQVSPRAFVLPRAGTVEFEYLIKSRLEPGVLWHVHDKSAHAKLLLGI